MTKSDLKFVRSLLERANPLKLMNEDGSSCVFFAKRFAYVEVLERIYAYAAITYLDVEYLLYRLYNKRGSTTKSMYMCYCKPLGIPEHVLLDPTFSKNKAILRDIVRALHAYCGTSFDTSEFDNAFTLFLAETEVKPVIKSSDEIKKEQESKSTL